MVKKNEKLKGRRLVALFIVGCLVFNYPFIFLFSGADTIAGIPVLFAYVFLSWMILLGLMALVIER